MSDRKSPGLTTVALIAPHLSVQTAASAIKPAPIVLPVETHAGGAATSGVFRLGFSTSYNQSVTVQLTRWMTDAQALAGFRVIGRVDAGGSPGLEQDWTIASLSDVPAEKGTLDHRTLHGNASMFTSYADFYASPMLAAAWHLPSLAGQTEANLLDLTFHVGGIATTSYMPFPHALGFGLAEPDAWETGGGGQDSANFELNGDYTDWFASSAPQGLHDELDFRWSGAAIAATLQLSLLQTMESKTAIVKLFYKGNLVYTGSPAPIQATGQFQPGNPSIATISLVNPVGLDGQSIHLVFDELRLQAAGGGFLVNGLALTMADNTTTPAGGRILPLSTDTAAGASQILYDAPLPAGFGVGVASGDGVLDIDNFNLDRGDQLIILKTDLVHLQITPTNAGNDLAVRFLNDPADLILLRGAGTLNIATSFHTLSTIGSNEVVLARQPLFS